MLENQHVSQASSTTQSRHHVVIVGGGFGGLCAARALRKANAFVTLIDRRNFHLFQPLLYQVATGSLSPANIATPLRSIVRRQKNVQVLMAEAVDIDPVGRRLLLQDGQLIYDSLILATGASFNYFGREDWSRIAPGLKTIEDATLIRARVLIAFEQAERETNLLRQAALLTFVIIGGGPTGVEMAGSLADMARYTLRHDFRSIDPSRARILLLEAHPKVLETYQDPLPEKAAEALAQRGVEIHTGTLVTDLHADRVVVKRGDHQQEIACHTILWTAGVKASPLGAALSRVTGTTIDRSGRILVEQDLSISGHPEIFVIGDLANFSHQSGQPLPGVAPVAMQQGRYVAKVIRNKLKGEPLPAAFHYIDKGSMATIGRSAAVVDVWGIRLWGHFAWLIWLFVHLMYIVQFQNRVLVFVQWAWNYITHNRSARLITDDAAAVTTTQTRSDQPPTERSES